MGFELARTPDGEINNAFSISGRPTPPYVRNIGSGTFPEESRCGATNPMFSAAFTKEPVKVKATKAKRSAIVMLLADGRAMTRRALKRPQNKRIEKIVRINAHSGYKDGAPPSDQRTTTIPASKPTHSFPS